jgi:hypothetical protein
MAADKLNRLLGENSLGPSEHFQLPKAGSPRRGHKVHAQEAQINCKCSRLAFTHYTDNSKQTIVEHGARLALPFFALINTRVVQKLTNRTSFLQKTHRIANHALPCLYRASGKPMDSNTMHSLPCLYRASGKPMYRNTKFTSNCALSLNFYVSETCLLSRSGTGEAGHWSSGASSPSWPLLSAQLRRFHKNEVAINSSKSHNRQFLS